ncbi:MAG: NAD(P)-dependent oxidoreductase [Phycicoccus sp.]|nr:NAD(P)-dependent oxidoreductase [Phycicoccus sp.]NMM35201.1 NAD(P)-dependent oxidoreductase [Phycicoccus sp.]
MAVDRPRFSGPVIVTGANGFIGRHLCNHLAAAGEDVHAIVRATSSRVVAHHPELTIHSLLNSNAEYAAVADAVQPTVVFHLATLFAPTHERSDIARMVDANVTFGSAVADAAARGGSRLIHATTAWQHHGGAEYSPVSLYAATKQALCDIIRYFTVAEGLLASEVCLFDTYGPWDDRKKLMWLLIEHAASGEPLPMSSGHQLIDLTHVNDVVAALVHVAADPPLGERLVARSGSPLSVRALSALVEQVTGRTIDTRWGEHPSRPREMEEDWVVPGATTSWRPEVDLTAGVAELWDERMSQRA